MQNTKVNRHGLAPSQVRIARRYDRKIGPRRPRIRKFSPKNKRKRKQQAGAGLVVAMAIDLGKGLQVRNLVKW